MSRRNFIVGSAAAAAALSSKNVLAHGVRPDQIKIGLIGCGGRGTGAATNAIEATDEVVIWAMADVFPDRMASSKRNLAAGAKEKFQVTDDRTFIGFDAYKHVLDTDIDVVIIATPPGFRPAHVVAAVEAGKHIFMEKPVAVDGPGIRKVIRASVRAKGKGLAIVAGTQRRHDNAYNECMDRIRSGQIGDVVASYAYWNQGGLWMHPRKDEWSDLEWQMRNWLYFTWLSGDHICEQHIHNIDVCNWAHGGHPVKCTSLAGREVRTDPAYGHVFDHFSTEYTYEDGSIMMSSCRQIDGCVSKVAEHIVGTKGVTNGNKYINGENRWRFEGERPNSYVLEHRNLHESIRSGNLLNEGVRVAESTLTAIMGRMSAYTGQEISWDQAFSSDEVLMPEDIDWNMDLAIPEVAVPGKTALS